MQKRTISYMVVAVFLLIGLAPVLSMLINSIVAEGRFSLGAYSSVLTSARQWNLMAHSAVLSLLVSTFATCLGVPLGLLLGKTDLPFKKTLTALFVIPLLIPPYIIAVAWVDFLGIQHLKGLWACVLVLSSAFLPIPMLLTMIFLRTINPRLEEAARLVSGWAGVLKTITLPLILPGILLGGIVVFLLTFGEFGVPNFLRYDVFAVESFTQFSAFYNFKAATASSVPLALVTLLVLLVEARFLRERTYQIRPTPDSIQSSTSIRLGKEKHFWLGMASLLAMALVIVPLLVLLLRSEGLNSYTQALERAGHSMVRSVTYAFWGATLLTIMGFFLGYIIHTKALAFWRSVDSFTIFLFALPATVIGIGLISLWNTPWTNFVYGTAAIIILGYLAKYTALTSRIMVTQFAQVPASMEEAAHISGAGWARTMFFIVAPLAKRGLLAGWIVAYIFSIRDTGISMLVYPPGHETLPVRIFTLMANGSEQLIAALCVLMIAATLVPAAILWSVPRLLAKRKVP